MSLNTSSDTLDATEATLRSSGYALLIGIEAYRSFDAQGRFDLPAGRNDVLAFYRVARKLGFRADRIRVLTTPLLEPRQLLEMERLLDPTAKEDDLEQRIAGVERREATRQEILDGERWLADKLTTKQVQGAHPLGLMTYSGHGSRLGNALDLCPSDVGPNLENAIDFSELRSILRGEPAEHLTIVLDCCFAEKDFDRQRGPFKLAYLPAARAGGASSASPEEDAPLASRVFSATRRDQNGYQSKFGGRWHGAFTWAFTVALDQWKIVEEEHFKRSTVSHGELLRRTRLLLDALDFPQEPTLAGEARIAELPLFHHASHASRVTAASPDRGRPDVQLDPTSCDYGYYVFSLDEKEEQILAQVIVTRTDKAPDGFGKGLEYWRIPENKYTECGTQFITTAQPLFITKRCMYFGDPLPFEEKCASFMLSQQANWESAQDTDRKSSEEAPSSVLWGNYGDGKRYVGFLANISKQGEIWRGPIIWWNSVKGNEFSEGESKERRYQYPLNPQMPITLPTCLWTSQNSLPWQPLIPPKPAPPAAQ